jgi:restriction system protein
MPVPTFDRFIEPLLRYLAEHRDGATTSATYAALAERLSLSADDVAEMLPSGAQEIYKNRIGWAQDRLKRAGLSESPKRGIWKLTEEGTAFAARHGQLSEADLARLVRVERESQLAPTTPMLPDGATPSAPPVVASPEERIDAALAELRDSVARDILDTIGNADPAFFERLVLDLLHAMGYGTSRSDLHRVGRSGDGGIDGIVSLDRLGLEKVYVQAKRWKSDVDSPTIRDFVGALQLQGASKGVIITTAAFTRPAREAADKARGSIVLIDGARLALLMIEHCVGVSHRTLGVPKVDSDYFEDA